MAFSIGTTTCAVGLDNGLASDPGGQVGGIAGGAQVRPPSVDVLIQMTS